MKPLTPSIALARLTLCMWISLPWFVSGCRMTAPVHSWKPPLSIRSPVHSLAIAPIAGNPETASRLLDALAVNRPLSGSQIAMIAPAELEQISSIQLVSYDGQPSDIAALNAARRAGNQLLLQGRIEKENLEPPPPNPKRKKKLDRPESIAVAWRLIDVASGETVDQEVLFVNRHEIEKTYPDLQFQGTGADKVIVGMARHSWNLMAPHLQQQETNLVLPWLTPGAGRIRRGNGYARTGNWEKAEREWQSAVDAYPFSKAAWHNLAISAMAREDWDLAERRLDHSKSWLKVAPTEKTSIWLEQQRRDYHAAFQLPPPAGGWKIPDSTSISVSQEVPPAKPQDIDDLPWWTSVPFVKPQGWTWTQWLSQPFWL